MRKAILKRIKITKTGKLLHRRSGQNHFNAKKSRRMQHRQARMATFSNVLAKKIKQYL